MILPGHRTFQPPPEQLDDAEKVLYERIEREFAVWLSDFGYLQTSEHGQELDYQLAGRLLQSMSAPVVVDIGMERGSFTQLALDAGAARVIGFEPLPRHVEYLRHKFSGQFLVEIHSKAVSRQSGRAQFHIATDIDGRELDYHHTLSDLGDSVTVIRSAKGIEVETVSLAELAATGVFPDGIDFLKIDTDGHDLAVLEGLGPLRPRIILAEYWDTLPETSGKNVYTLADLSIWALTHGYRNMVAVRRHTRLEFIEWDMPWTLPGDWGNVFFIRDDVELEYARTVVSELARTAFEKTCLYVSGLVKECDAKEAEIRRLDNALQQERNMSVITEQHPASAGAGAQSSKKSPAEIRRQTEDQHLRNSIITIHDQLRMLLEMWPAGTDEPDWCRQLLEKETVIQDQKRALTAYRKAHANFGPLLEWAAKCAHAILGPIRKWLATILGIFLWPLKFSVRAARAVSRIRLGNLNQHPPRPLVLSRNYVSILPPKKLPTIAIVTPSYNQAAFIERTIQSVLDQAYPRLEFLVQDGGSQDGTKEILQRYTARLSGWQSAKDGGQSHAINIGFGKTNGEIMAWLNSDDVLLPGALACVGEYFARHPEVDVVYGHRILIDENDQQIGRWMLPAHDDDILSWADYIPQETLFWRRRIWDKVGGRIDESFSFAMDWDLLVRFREAGASFARLPRFLGGFRIHECQKTSATINEIGYKEMDRIRERALGRVPSRKEIRRAVRLYLLKHIAEDMAFRIKTRLRGTP